MTTELQVTNRQLQVNEGLGNPTLELVDSVEKGQEFLRWLGQRRPLNAVSVDIETGEIPGRDKKDALSPWHGKIRLAQVGDGVTGWAIPWEDWRGVFLQGMGDYEGPVVMHNCAFEQKWLHIHSPQGQIPWNNVHDTMIMSQVIQPDAPSHALKTLTSRMIDPRASALQSFLDETMVKNGWSWGTIPVDFGIYWQYGALDTVITSRLFLDHFYEQVRPGAYLAPHYDLEMATKRIAVQMELNGSRVDLEYSEAKYKELTDYAEAAKSEGFRVYGQKLTSPSQLVTAIENLGGEITKRTKSGAPSVDKESLEIIYASGGEDIRQLVGLVLNIRKAEKLASSYFFNFQKDAVDGILHPDIMTLEARTGRMSIRNPALQTLPSKDSLVRGAFIARNPDEVLISSDLDQVEMRLMAALSKDESLIQVFRDADETGGDFFTTVMRQVYKDDTLTKSDPRRGLIKANRYASIYGAGIDKQASTAGVPVADMQEVEDGFNRMYPGVRKFAKDTEAFARQKMSETGSPYILTAGGRPLPVDEYKIYAGVNYRLQGSAAEIMKNNLVRIDASGLTEYMMLPVHDEVVMSVPKDSAEEIRQVVKECMTTSEGWPLTLSADAEIIGTNWGDKYRKKS